jgi:polyisoprenoid-binding protein YceI
MIIRTLFCLALMTTNALAADWSLDPDRSKLAFEGTQGGVPFQGSFDQFSANISLDPDDLTSASINVTIDPASATSGSAERDGTLPSADWFDVATHPEATFTSTTISQTENGYLAEGTLTLKGTSQAASLPFTLAITGEEAHAMGALTIDRGDYNVGTGALSPMVGAEVVISFDVTAIRER